METTIMLALYRGHIGLVYANLNLDVSIQDPGRKKQPYRLLFLAERTLNPKP